MSRVERVEAYANPVRKSNWRGEGRDKACLDRWIARATDNSQLAKRARGGEVGLPDTSGDMALHDTSSKPRRRRDVDARMIAKADVNSDGGSSFMPGTRRSA